MPRYSTYPTLYDEAMQLNISKLKQWGCLNETHHARHTLTWSSTSWHGTYERGSISMTVNMITARPYIELDYNCNEEPYKYRVMLVSIPSNLGKGNIWYFRCPQTNKRCRKLYLVGGYFLHRAAFKGCMYESQIQSKKYRELDRTFGVYFKADNLYNQLYQKHFKKTYAGKPTKKYLRIMEQIDKSERISYLDIERHLIL